MKVDKGRGEIVDNKDRKLDYEKPNLEDLSKTSTKGQADCDTGSGAHECANGTGANIPANTGGCSVGTGVGGL